MGMPELISKVGITLLERAKRSSFTDWCLAAFTLALVVLGYFQFKTMNSQRNITQKDEQAWLEFDIQPDKTALQIANGQPVSFPFQVMNIGKTPATNIYGKIYVDLLDAT